MSVFLIYVLSELGRKIRRNLFMDIFAILSLIGGLALFLYGMNVMGDGLTKVSGGKLENLHQRSQMQIYLAPESTPLSSHHRLQPLW